jgi:hypothetical protein
MPISSAQNNIGGMMKRGLILIALLVLVSAVITGAASTQPLGTPSTGNVNDPWHITVLPAGAQSAAVSQAVLWNSKTGETWLWTGNGEVKWMPMAHAPQQ